MQLRPLAPTRNCVQPPCGNKEEAPLASGRAQRAQQRVRSASSSSQLSLLASRLTPLRMFSLARHAVRAPLQAKTAQKQCCESRW